MKQTAQRHSTRMLVFNQLPESVIYKKDKREYNKILINWLLLITFKKNENLEIV